MNKEKNGTDELCVHCGKKKVHIVKWQLCGACYQKKYKKNELEYFKTDKTQMKIKKLKEKYGEEIISDFDKLNMQPFWNLVDIARKNNFSREYARIIYNILYGKPYQEIQNKKMLEVKKDLSTVCVHHPKRKLADCKNEECNVYKAALTESMFYEECKKRGFNINVPCRPEIDITVNGYNIDVKSCFQSTRTSKKNNSLFYRFVMSSYQFDNSDFIAFYHATEKTFFIIPIEEIKKDSKQNSRNGTHTVYVRESISCANNAKNRFWEYKDAWRLLSPPPK